MKTTNRKLWAVVAIVAVIALIAVAACQAPPATPTGPVHVVLDNAYEIGASGDGPAGAAGDTNLTNLSLSGDLTVAGTSSLAGGVSWTWPQSVIAPTAVATATPAFYVDNPGAGNVSFEVRDAGTPVFQVLNGGAVKRGNGYLMNNPASGKVYVAGITSAVVQKATVVPTVSYISTVTAFGCVPDDAAFNGAWDCRAAMGATNNITFTLYNVSATPVPTAAYDEIRYWVTGN